MNRGASPRAMVAWHLCWYQLIVYGQLVTGTLDPEVRYLCTGVTIVMFGVGWS